jgi:ribonucleoside-diphosphate reductase alpha chain
VGWGPASYAILGVMKLTPSGKTVVEARFLRRDEAGQLIESPEEMCLRVASHVAKAELNWGGKPKEKLWCEVFREALDSGDFLPNSPTLSNAGTALGQLSACFVLPVEDSMEGIFDSLKLMAIIQQTGGGTGFSFSRLRPAGDRVSRTGGAASGPVSFMRIFDTATENIRQGGRRRGANMGILRMDHKDISLFVNAKKDGKSFRNFNLSVGVTDAFMKGVESGKKESSALFEEIARAAWETGDPGLIFLDTINKSQPTPRLGEIEATNPCGEVPLLPYEACTLGSINLSHVVGADGINWKKLEKLVELGTRFLDNVVEISEWPDPRIKDIVGRNRKIGLGVMGFAEMLILMEIPYASKEAAKVGEKVMRFINEKALEASIALAEERGAFANWEKSIYAKGPRLRNATRTSIAPTGTIGLVAGTSAGIEPLFALAYRRHALDGHLLTELNTLFVKYLENLPDKGEAVISQVTSVGNLSQVSGVPEKTKELFRTALELTPKEHLAVQCAFQEYTDNAVSKTINLPETATANDIREIYFEAWKKGLKGITVFRYGSKTEQVLELGMSFPRCDPSECKL